MSVVLLVGVRVGCRVRLGVGVGVGLRAVVGISVSMGIHPLGKFLENIPHKIQFVSSIS